MSMADKLIPVQMPPKRSIPFQGNDAQFSAILRDQTKKFEHRQEKKITAL